MTLPDLFLSKSNMNDLSASMPANTFIMRIWLKWPEIYFLERSRIKQIQRGRKMCFSKSGEASEVYSRRVHA